MAEVRVRLPLGALDEQDVGKPGIPRVSGARDRRFKSGHPDFLIRHQIAVIDLPVKQGTEVRPLLPELLNTEGQANRRWQPPRKRSSDELTTLRAVPRVLLPHLPPCAPLADWHKASAFQAEQAGSIPGTVRSMVVALWNVIGDRLVVGRLALDQKTEVRPLLPEPLPGEPCLAG